MGRHSVPDPEDSPDADAGPDDRHPEESSAGAADHWQPDPDGEFPHLDDHDGDHDDGARDWGHDRDDRGDSDDPEAATHAFAATPPSSRDAGPQHGGDWDGGEWTGSHRAIQPGRRGISVGVIVALVTVVVVVGAVILWRFFGDALSHRTQVGAARCVSGDLAVAVIVDPSLRPAIGPLADAYNQSAEPVGDKCVKVGVTSADSDRVVDGFAGQWPADLGDRPALWIPASSVSEARLEAAAGAQTVSDSRSLVTSPVLLAVRPQLKTALAQQDWSALPGLQSSTSSLDELNLPSWGSLRLALPTTGDSDATYLVAEAVAAASAPQGAPVTSGANAVAALVAGQPKLADTASSTALNALLAAGDPARGDVHAVATTEQQIFQQGVSQPSAEDQLTGWLPPGPVPVADFPTVQLAGNGLSAEQVSAASEFARFLRKPESLASLAQAGFRADGVAPPKSDVTDFGPLPATLAVGEPAARATLANLVGTPAQNPAVTILLDQSMDTVEDGKSRVANVAAALNARLQALNPTSAVGLWTFDGVSGRSEIPTGPLADPVGGQPRSAALTANLDGQVASDGGAVSFTTLRLLYADAVAKFRDGQTNSVLVITSGPHTDQSLDGAGLQSVIRQTFNQSKPVSIDVLDFGDDSDRATWEAVAQVTGGSYQNLASSAGPELTTALAAALA